MNSCNIILSIIIPHHNIPNLLERCLNTIPEREDIQVIVVDDNSDSNVVDFSVFPGLTRKNVEVILTKEGRGAGYARNIGMANAKGKWLLFVDSDDFLMNEFYDIISAYFDSDYDMLMFKAKSVDSDTLKITNRNENINLRIDQAISGLYDVKEVALAVQSPWCRMIRRSFVEKEKIRFDEVMACNDAMFTTKVTCLASSIGFSKQIIYVVTQRTGSLWSSRKTNMNNYLTRLKIQIERNKYVKKFGYKQSLILDEVFNAWKINPILCFRAFLVSILNNGVFQGLDWYLKGKCKKILRLL